MVHEFKYRPMLGPHLTQLLHPFKELADHTIIKLVIIGTAAFSQLAGVFRLFDTPTGYVSTLFILMIFDSISRVWRVIFNPECKFDPIRLIKGFVYKLGVYAWLVLPFTVYSNQFEPGSNYLVYVIYIALATLELFSIARHWRVVGYIIAIAKQLRTGKIDAKELSELAEQHDVLAREEEE